MRARLPRRLLVPLLLLAAALLTPAGLAARIGIDAGDDPNSRLEIRTITLPDGTEVQLYVLQGDGLRVTIDDSVLAADHVEVDLTNRLVRVIGFGRYEAGAEVVEGHDLVIDLRDESFVGDDVLIISDQVTVTGDRASRVPGLIRVAMGQFSPCALRPDMKTTASRPRPSRSTRVTASWPTGHRASTRRGSHDVTHHGVDRPQDRQPRLEYVTARPPGAPDNPELALRGRPDMRRRGRALLRRRAAGYSAVGDMFLGGQWAQLPGRFPQHRYRHGQGSFSVDYTPAFHTATGQTERLFTCAWPTRQGGAGPAAHLVVKRDARRPQLWEPTRTKPWQTAGGGCTAARSSCAPRVRSSAQHAGHLCR